MLKGIKYLSYVDSGGYSSAAMAYINGLSNAGMPLTWMPFVFGQYCYIPWTSDKNALPLEVNNEKNSVDTLATRLFGAIHKQLNYDTVLMHTQPEYWSNYWEQGKRRVGYTVWETDHIPRHWTPLLNTAERIIVPCRFNVDVFQGNGVKCPISIVPHIYRIPYDVSIEEIAAFRRQLGIRDDQFVFYSINAWTARKAMWETVTAFLEAFSASESVVFVIKTDAAGVRNEDATEITPTPRIIAELCAGRRQIPEIKLICRQMSLREIDILHRIGNCYISLTHSEGWGLGAFDATGIGNPVIITGWGGHLDYLPVNYFGLVDYRLVPVRDRLGSHSYETRQHWAEAEREHAVHLMREIFRDPAANQSIAGQSQDHIRATFSESSVIKLFIEALNEPHTA